MSKVVTVFNKDGYIAISLCDNDFGNMMVPLLECLNKHIQWKENVSEEYLKLCITELLRPMYLMYMSNEPYFDSELNGALTYLRSSIKILFNEEATKEALSVDHDGGSYLLECSTGTITRY